jgi:hypothetical protein
MAHAANGIDSAVGRSRRSRRLERLGMGSFPATLKLASSYWQKSLHCVELGRAAYVSGRISIVLAVNGRGHGLGHDHGAAPAPTHTRAMGGPLLSAFKANLPQDQVLRSGWRLREAARFFVAT